MEAMMTGPQTTTPGAPWYRRPRGILFAHTLRVVLLGYVIGPLAASLALVVEEAAFTLPLALSAGILFGRLSASGMNLPPKISGRYTLPLLFCWIMGFTFLPFFIALSLSSASLTAMRFLPDLYVLGLVPGFVCFEQRRENRVLLAPAVRALLCLLPLVPLAHTAHGIYSDRVYSLKRGHGFAKVGGFAGTDLKTYDPRVPGSVTPRLDDAATFIAGGTENLPVLDGAEAAFPVYAAFAAACYPDMAPLSDEDLRYYDFRGINHTGPLQFHNTIVAFRKLVDGKADIFFGSRPSENQARLAIEKNRKLTLTPIGREAFVFFVNEANPVSGLTSEQVRDIYSGKVRNWKALGGGDAEIIAFQRPEDSGSQTVMRRFMGDTPLEPPLKDHYVGGMGGIVDRISEYRNAPSAIGYSFLFFLTGLGKRPRIKTLAVDGIPPTPETIRSGAYPFVVNLYAVTLEDNPNPHIAPFLEWMQGEQGQELIEKIGYVRVQNITPTNY
jgi:phosphate transport system substrate-binding protein